MGGEGGELRRSNKSEETATQSSCPRRPLEKSKKRTQMGGKFNFDKSRFNAETENNGGENGEWRVSEPLCSELAAL